MISDTITGMEILMHMTGIGIKSRLDKTVVQYVWVSDAIT